MSFGEGLNDIKLWIPKQQKATDADESASQKPERRNAHANAMRGTLTLELPSGLNAAELVIQSQKWQLLARQLHESLLKREVTVDDKSEARGYYLARPTKLLGQLLAK